MLAGSLDRGAQNLLAYAYGGEVLLSYDGNLRSNAFPGGTFGDQLPCKDGYINIMCNPRWWDRFCRMIGREDLIHDSRYVDNLPNPAFGPKVDALLLPWLLERTKIEAMDQAQAHGVPVPVAAVRREHHRGPPPRPPAPRPRVSSPSITRRQARRSSPAPRSA